ncbi:hypothetical protein O181_047558 [Austropuccinia psidii MF-1]|uniref:Reverse transcriptase Ty1/copia-type domain-containing protein n=1 Tax=Austropuccinia psidii MF-1 TaxID=1389203 RepID=A0A9Q3DU80_9BASI|nr:hypothetical protein [Austropuccinia psidii MF-1]
MKNLNFWNLIDLNKDYKLVGTTWVFKIKKNHLNETIEYKARLCPQGFTQPNGIDYNKTYAPTGCLNPLRTLTAHAVNNKLKFHQIDIKIAFLDAPLIEDVYLAIPQGINLDPRNNVLNQTKQSMG